MTMWRELFPDGRYICYSDDDPDLPYDVWGNQDQNRRFMEKLSTEMGLSAAEAPPDVVRTFGYVLGALVEADVSGLDSVLKAFVRGYAGAPPESRYLKA